MQVLLKVLVKTLALRLAEVMAKLVSDTLEHVKAKTLVIKFAATVAEMKARTTRRTLRTADTLQEVRVRIITAY